MKIRVLYIVLFALLAISCKDGKKGASDAKSGATKKWVNTLIYPEEVHFKSMQQITFGGDNAEAYWSFDDKQIIFQSNNKNWGVDCDQMFLMNVGETFKDTIPPMISTGFGRTTCAYFLPDNKSYVYGSTHLGGKECPPAPLRREGKYVWPIYESYDIFVADLKGNITKQLTTEPGYDAEATVSPKGDKIVFTSMRTEI